MLPSEEVTSVHGIPCVTPERAVFDALRLAPNLQEAVVAMDMAAAGEVTSLLRMRAYAASRSRAKGMRRVREALRLASEHSWSPQETRMRMVWRLEAGLPEPLLNRPLFDLRGRLLCYPDLLDEDAGVVGEFDGADHRGARRHSEDVARETLLRQHLLELFRVTGHDLGARGRIRSRMLSTRRRARWLPAGRRPWTTTPPSWWDPGPTLDERLEDRDLLRESEAR